MNEKEKTKDTIKNMVSSCKAYTDSKSNIAIASCQVVPPPKGNVTQR